MEGGREEKKEGRRKELRKEGRKERRKEEKEGGILSFLHGNENPIMSLSYPKREPNFPTCSSP